MNNAKKVSIKGAIGSNILKLSIAIRNKIDRRRLTNCDFTIFANNCSAGCMYHDLDLRFDSPTINLYIYPEHYLNFLENLDYYLSQDLYFLAAHEKREPFPVAKIGDQEREIYIFFNHYKNEDCAREKWNERIKRIHWDNLYIIMSDQNGCTNEQAKRFDKLPFKNKVFYSSRVISGVDCLHLIPDSGNGEVVTLTHYINVWGKRYFSYNFDYVKWLNVR